MSVDDDGVTDQHILLRRQRFVAAASGLTVIMNDISDEFCQRGLQNITKLLGRSVEKGKLPESEKTAILDRIRISTDIKDMAEADLPRSCRTHPASEAAGRRPR